jgi:ABC-type branched-subunit amino acid transport system ATPase component
LDLGGGLDSEDAIIRRSGAATSVQFISTASLTQESLARLYDRVVLANEEDLVVRALNAVEENTITKIAAVERSESGGYGSSRGIVVGLRGSVEPVPLGNLGDGMTRMLAIALSLVAARNGYLLVDEIDTGLHYTVMRKMWKLVFETATRLNVCVYATTHSYDCVHALAAIARPGVQQDGEVSLIRVDRERPDAVHFSEREITLLAEREIEAR